MEFTDIVIKAAQFILSLSILIVLHELGHFLPAKWFGTRVEKFYLFFDYKFSLFKKKIGDTEYGIGWIPLGGYVKISGMIDESMDKEQMKEEPKPWEMRSKPAWQRLIIMLGGVTVNMILAMILFSGVFWIWGQDYLKVDDMKYGIDTVDTLATNMGLRNGDLIIKVEDEKIEHYKQILPKIILNEATELTVLRDGETKVLEIPYHLNKTILARKRNGFIDPRTELIVNSVVDTMAAAKAGLKANDQIVGVNDVETFSFNDFRKEIVKHKGESIDVVYLREGVRDTVNVAVDTNGIIGFSPKSYAQLLNYTHQTFTFTESWPAGIGHSLETLRMTAKQIPLMFSSQTEGYKSMGGFMTMGSLFAPVWDWRSFWWMTAFLSVMLAFMNVLPIPALDGGHVLFLLYEMIVGRKPSDKFMEYAQMVGFFLLLSLLLYANGNDIYKAFFK